MNSYVRKWGNSPAIRVPLSILDAAKLHIDQAIDIRQEDGRIIIEACDKPPRYNLAELLAGVNSENLHAQTDWGEDIGAEIIHD
jgi:antitoxin MazE